LELTIPGIDLNDPGKTVCGALRLSSKRLYESHLCVLGVACMLIVSILQYVKIGDLTQYEAPPLADDTSSSTDVDPDLPAGPFTPMAAEEEDSLTRQSTGAFSGELVLIR
jgi:proteasome activator subunit 4